MISTCFPSAKKIKAQESPLLSEAQNLQIYTFNLSSITFKPMQHTTTFTLLTDGKQKVSRHLVL